MRNLTKVFLCIVIVVLLVAVIQRIQISDTTTIDTTDYWYEEMDLLYLYYINKK